MVFPNVQSVFRLDAFVGNARTHHLGQAIDVDSVHVEGMFDLGAHRIRPRFGAENADF